MGSYLTYAVALHGRIAYLFSIGGFRLAGAGPGFQNRSGRVERLRPVSSILIIRRQFLTKTSSIYSAIGSFK